MKFFFKEIYNAIENKIDILPSNIDDKSRRLFYFVFLIIGPPSMLIFGTSGLLRGDRFLFISLFFLAAGVIAGWFFLLKHKNGLFAYRMNSFVYAIIIIYILYIGGEGGSKILWSYTFPLIVIFLFGKKEGVVWCTIYLCVALTIILPDWELNNQYDYHYEFKIRFVYTYILVSAITYWFEYLRHEYRSKLESKNEILKHQIDKNIKIQKELEESEKLFRSIFDQAGVGVSLTCSRTGKLLKVNKKYCDIMGYSPEELQKITFQQITHSEDLEPDIKNLEKLREGLISFYSLEKRQIKKDGSIVWVLLTVSVVSTLKKQHIGIIQDITNRKLLEEEVKTLEGIIPICSGCKKIRDDEGYWNQIETYINEHSAAEFSHSMCPECTERIYGDEDWYKEMKRKKGFS